MMAAAAGLTYEDLLISIRRSALTASGFFAQVTFRTPLSNLASTLDSSMLSGSRRERSKLPFASP